MNYSGFKKVHEDNDKAILKHKNGSELKIAKKTLQPKHLEALKKLPLYAAGGGDVEAEGEPDRTPATAPVNIYLGGQQPQTGRDPLPPQYSEGPPPDTRPTASYQSPGAKGGSFGPKDVYNALMGSKPEVSGTELKKYGSMDEATAAQRYYKQNPQIQNPDTQPPQIAPASVGSLQPMSAVSPGQTLAPQQSVSQPQAQAPQAAPEPEVGNEPVAPLQQIPIQTQQQPMASPGDQFMQQMKLWSQDLNVHPKTYSDILWKNPDGSDKSTLGKIGTLFGMLMSGAGSGLAHQPNAVMQMMDNEINKDFEAQKTNRTNAMDFGKLVDQHLLNQSNVNRNQADVHHLALQDAVVNTEYKLSAARRAKVQQLYQEIVSKYPEGSPQRQQGMAALGMLSQGLDAKDQSAAVLINSRAALYNNLMNGDSSQGPDSSGPVNYKKMNQLQQQSQMKMPGAPSESEFASMTKEAGSLEETRALRTDFNNAYNALDKMAIAGKLSPHARDSYVNSLAGKLAKASAGRYNDAEAKKQLQSMIPEVGDWKSTRDIRRSNNDSFFDILDAGTPTLNRRGLKNAVPGQRNQQQASQGNTIERYDPKSKRTVIYDAKTKAPLGFKR